MRAPPTPQAADCRASSGQPRVAATGHEQWGHLPWVTLQLSLIIFSSPAALKLVGFLQGSAHPQKRSTVQRWVSLFLAAGIGPGVDWILGRCDPEGGQLGPPTVRFLLLPNGCFV